MTAQYTQEQLEAAFDLVNPMKVSGKPSWKYPINVEIETDNIDVVLRSIDHFVGGHGCHQKLGENKYHVTAPGYYLIIGA